MRTVDQAWLRSVVVTVGDGSGSNVSVRRCWGSTLLTECFNIDIELSIPVLTRNQLLEVSEHSGVIRENILFEAVLGGGDVWMLSIDREHNFNLHHLVNFRLDLKQGKYWSFYVIGRPVFCEINACVCCWAGAFSTLLVGKLSELIVANESIVLGSHQLIR